MYSRANADTIKAYRDLVTEGSASWQDSIMHREGIEYLYDWASPRNIGGKRGEDTNTGDMTTTRTWGDISVVGNATAMDNMPQNPVYLYSGDPSFNGVSIFTLSNLFYGKRIHPGTFSIKDENLSGSSNKISISLADDGSGGLYRNDCRTKRATWNTVGNIFYNEGIAIIKSPHLTLFGKDQFETSFSGSQNLHTMTVNIPARVAQLNSSSNPVAAGRVTGHSGWIPEPVSSSLNVNDTDNEFVYITGLYLHDDNYNVIMRVNLAQPLMKRSTDAYFFRVRMDF